MAAAKANGLSLIPESTECRESTDSHKLPFHIQTCPYVYTSMCAYTNCINTMFRVNTNTKIFSPAINCLKAHVCPQGEHHWR